MARLNRSQGFSALLVVLLIVVWSIPDSIALRNLLLGMLCLVVFTSTEGRSSAGGRLFGSAEGWVYLGLSAWLICQALFWAWFPHETWGELKGQWFKGTVIFLMGMGFAGVMANGNGNSRRAMQVVYGALAFAICLQLVDYIWAWFVHGQVPMNSDGIFRGKVQVSYLGNLFFAMTMAEVFARQSQARTTLRLGWSLLVAGAIVAATVVMLSGARNGVIGLVMLFATTMGLAWWFTPHAIASKGRWRWPLVAGICIASLVFVDWKFDPRWRIFNDTLPYALNTEVYKSWLDAERYPFPHLPSGQVVDISAYERVSFITVGLKLASHLPLGIGYTRKAFTHAVETQYGHSIKHAHSGMIEYLIAMGWPGVIGWLVFLGLALRRAIRMFLQRRSSLGLMTAFLVTGFAGRMMIENITRDHMLEMFLFLLGLLLASLYFEQQEEEQACIELKKLS